MGDSLSIEEDVVPWKEWSVMDKRLRFVARLLEGEEMSFLRREFGISRKMGHKVYDRNEVEETSDSCPLWNTIGATST